MHTYTCTYAHLPHGYNYTIRRLNPFIGQTLMRPTGSEGIGAADADWSTVNQLHTVSFFRDPVEADCKFSGEIVGDKAGADCAF